MILALAGVVVGGLIVFFTYRNERLYNDPRQRGTEAQLRAERDPS